uniref:Uncharacterized protein n=1 Tax=Rhizophora mucronata TaxID=61149 RepID=A0A2P2PZ39_RHIMU
MKLQNKLLLWFVWKILELAFPCMPKIVFLCPSCRQIVQPLDITEEQVLD